MRLNASTSVGAMWMLPGTTLVSYSSHCIASQTSSSPGSDRPIGRRERTSPSFPLACFVHHAIVRAPTSRTLEQVKAVKGGAAGARAAGKDLEITGNVVVNLFLASTHDDGALFIHLEKVALDGKVTHLMEGARRLKRGT